MSLLSNFLELGGMPAAARFLEANEKYGKYLRQVKEKVGYAVTFREYFVGDSAFLDTLVTVDNKLGTITDTLDKIEGKITDLRALNELGKALGYINATTIRQNPRAAAQNFGVVFVNAGRIARFLPFPLSEFGSFLAQFEDFFVNIYDATAPDGVRRGSFGRGMRYLNSIDPMP